MSSRGVTARLRQQSRGTPGFWRAKNVAPRGASEEGGYAASTIFRGFGRNFGHCGLDIRIISEYFGMILYAADSYAPPLGLYVYHM